MAEPIPRTFRRVLIVSSHPLFGQGLRSLLLERKEIDIDVIGTVSTLEEALLALDKYSPELIIIDYDDQVSYREELLAHFMEGEKKQRVVLLSLHSDQEALVYDRRTTSGTQIDNWLKEWD